MASEKKIHELIEKKESSDKQDRQVVWDRLQEKVRQQDTVEVDCDNVVVQDKGNTISLAGRKKALWIILASTVVLFVVLALCLTLLRNNKPDNRYCTESDYTSSESTLTIKGYASANDIELLFFNWYDDTEFCKDRIYKLIDSEEVICIRESMMDMNTGYIVTLAFTDDRTEMDLFDTYKTTCVNSETVSGTEVQWGIGEYSSHAKFAHKGYSYFLEVEDAIEEEFLMNYLEILLS